MWSKVSGKFVILSKSFLESSYLLIKYLYINSAVLHYTCMSHCEYALLLDVT